MKNSNSVLRQHVQVQVASVSVLAAWTVFLCGLFGGTAFASDGTLTINGRVQNNTCAIAVVAGTTAPSSGSANLTLNLASIPYSAILNHGTAALSTPFTIGVYNCGANGSTMNVSFDAGGGMNNAGVLANTGTANAAIAFRIMNADNTTPVTTGTPNATAASLSSAGAGGTGGGSQTFYVQYYNSSASTTLTAAMAGTVVGSVTYTVEYT